MLIYEKDDLCLISSNFELQSPKSKWGTGPWNLFDLKFVLKYTPKSKKSKIQTKWWKSKQMRWFELVSRQGYSWIFAAKKRKPVETPLYELVFRQGSSWIFAAKMRKAACRESPVHVAGYCDHPDPLSDLVGWLKFRKLIHIRRYPLENILLGNIPGR